MSTSSYGSAGYGSAVYGGYGDLWNAPKSTYGGYLTSGNYYPSYVYQNIGYGAPVHGGQGYAAPARVGHSFSAAPSYGGYGALWNVPKSPYGGYLTSGNYYPSYVYQNIGYGAPVHGYNSSPIHKGY